MNCQINCPAAEAPSSAWELWARAQKRCTQPLSPGTRPRPRASPAGSSAACSVAGKQRADINLLGWTVQSFKAVPDKVWRTTVKLAWQEQLRLAQCSSTGRAPAEEPVCLGRLRPVCCSCALSLRLHSTQVYPLQVCNFLSGSTVLSLKRYTSSCAQQVLR